MKFKLVIVPLQLSRAGRAGLAGLAGLHSACHKFVLLPQSRIDNLNMKQPPPQQPPIGWRRNNQHTAENATLAFRMLI